MRSCALFLEVRVFYICVGTICCNAFKCLLQRLLDWEVTPIGMIHSLILEISLTLKNRAGILRMDNLCRKVKVVKGERSFSQSFS